MLADLYIGVSGQALQANQCDVINPVRLVSRSSSPRWGSIRFRAPICTYAPHTFHWAYVQMSGEIKKKTLLKNVTAFCREQATRQPHVWALKSVIL